MKKYYDYANNNEEFKMEKGTINEIKDYLGRVDVYMYQNEDSKKWYMSFAKGWIDHEGHESYGIWIPPYWKKVTTEDLAHLCGYWE